MDLNQLKNQWTSEQGHKGQDEISDMVAQKSKSVSARARRKAVIEAITFALVLLVFFTGLDPERNHFLVNIFLVLAVLAGVVNNLLLYRNMLINPQGESVAATLRRRVSSFKQQLSLSIAFSVLLFAGAYTFLLASVPISGSKVWWVLLVLVLSILVRSWFEVRRWRSSIRQLTQCQVQLSATTARAG